MLSHPNLSTRNLVDHVLRIYQHAPLLRVYAHVPLPVLHGDANVAHLHHHENEQRAEEVRP
jgi:hypothetical protein